MSTAKRPPMKRRTRKGGARSTLSFQGALTIYEAREAKARLTDALGRGGALEIDLSEVSEIDTAGVQLLVLAKLAATAAGKTARLVNYSQTVLDAIDLYHLAAFLGVVPAAPKGAS